MVRLSENHFRRTFLIRKQSGACLKNIYRWTSVQVQRLGAKQLKSLSRHASNRPATSIKTKFKQVADRILSLSLCKPLHGKETYLEYKGLTPIDASVLRQRGTLPVYSIYAVGSRTNGFPAFRHGAI